MRAAALRLLHILENNGRRVLVIPGVSVKSHSIQTYRRMAGMSKSSPQLRVAALFHDIGWAVNSKEPPCSIPLITAEMLRMEGLPDTVTTPILNHMIVRNNDAASAQLRRVHLARMRVVPRVPHLRDGEVMALVRDMEISAGYRRSKDGPASY